MARHLTKRVVESIAAEVYQKRGSLAGYDLDNWLEAENIAKEIELAIIARVVESIAAEVYQKRGSLAGYDLDNWPEAGNIAKEIELAISAEETQDSMELRT